MLEMVGNIWDNLTELSRTDPHKYHEIVEESQKECKLMETLPVPHTCFKVKSVSRWMAGYYGIRHSLVDSRVFTVYVVQKCGEKRLPKREAYQQFKEPF